MAGEHPLQCTVIFPSGETQVRVLLWSPSQNTNGGGVTCSAVTPSPAVRGEKSKSMKPSSESGWVGGAEQELGPPLSTPPPPSPGGGAAGVRVGGKLNAWLVTMGQAESPMVPFGNSSDTATPPAPFPTIHFRLPFYDFTTQFFLEFYGISLKPPEGDTAPFLGVK